MDPIDQEKPWSVGSQLVVITCAIGLVYLAIRFVVVIPDWGWQLIIVATVVGVLLYHSLAFKRAPRVRTGPSMRPRASTLLAFVVILVLTLPLALGIYMLWVDAG